MECPLGIIILFFSLTMEPTVSNLEEYQLKRHVKLKKNIWDYILTLLPNIGLPLAQLYYSTQSSDLSFAGNS